MDLLFFEDFLDDGLVQDVFAREDLAETGRVLTLFHLGALQRKSFIDLFRLDEPLADQHFPQLGIRIFDLTSHPFLRFQR